MKCRLNCAACCIVPSISSSIPGMPNGKPAGEPCIHLTEEYKCKLFNSRIRPKVCSGFMPEKIVCGSSQKEAFRILYSLEGIKDNEAISH